MQSTKASREQVNLHLPDQFKHQYTNTRVIIDVSEVFIQQPTNPTAQQLTCSTYKNHNTLSNTPLGMSKSAIVEPLSAVTASPDLRHSISSDIKRILCPKCYLQTMGK